MYIVRRRVRITTSGVIDVPFQCAACGLATMAHAQVEGVGTASAAYISPNEQVARDEAHADMRRTAQALVEACLCPRCGAPTQMATAKLAAWDAKNPQGEKRKWTPLLVGLGISAFLALCCMGSMIAFPSKGSTPADMVGGGACGAAFFFVIGAAISLVVYLVMGPGKRPSIATTNPTNVWFDRPPGATP